MGLVRGHLAALTGVVITVLAVAVPAWRDARARPLPGHKLSTADTRAASPVWWVAIALLLGLAGYVFRMTEQRGYSLVVAPEGVPSISVDYKYAGNMHGIAFDARPSYPFTLSVFSIETILSVSIQMLQIYTYIILCKMFR